MVYFFIGLFLFVAGISWLWATGINNMQNTHPDYKGEDFLNENKNNMI
jgi:hypothetical protein